MDSTTNLAVGSQAHAYHKLTNSIGGFLGSMSWGNIVMAVMVASIAWAVVDLWMQRGRKGPIRWPILGSSVEVMRNYHRLNDWIVPYLQDSLTVRAELANVTYTFTADPANVEHVLKNNFSNYPKGAFFHEAFDIFLGDGIFNTDGEVWRKQRKIASFEFASRVLRDFSTVVFRDHSLTLAAIFNHAATMHQSVEMQDLFMRFTLDSICKISFGIEIGSLKPSLPNIPFAKAFEVTNEITSSRFLDPWWKLKRFFGLGSEATVLRSAKEVDDFIYNVIRTRKAEMAAMRSTRTANAFGQTRRDLFTRLWMLNEEGGEQFTDKNFRDTLLNFVIAGRDTTAVTLSWFVYMMTLHPEAMMKVYDELCAFEKENEIDLSIADLDEHGDGAVNEGYFNQRVQAFAKRLNFDSLLKLQYLYAAILETLRLYPAVPTDAKGVLADDVLPDGTKVKKGSMIMYTAYGMGRMTSLWGPDAFEFKPERWLKDGVVQHESPFKFTAFQAGPRICLGKDSAMLQLRMASAILFRFFTFQVVPGFNVKYRQMSTLLMADGLQVNVTKRLN